MVVYTYAEDETDIKEFILPTTLNSTGFNIPLLNDNGYFVFYVQSYVSDQGPAISALESVTSGVKAILKKESAINDLKIGLIGHSFGGYKVSYIATQTDMFAAIISGAGPHDIIGGTMYRYNTYRNAFDLYMAEKGQFEFKDNYAENPQKYIDNSPILHAHKVKTPMLMWTGLKDDNVLWENTRKMFVALKRYQIPTIALFYKNVEHDIMPNQFIENTDLTFRIMDWFDYFLKDYKDIDWINKGIDYDNYSWNQLDTF
ncbi:alpha/beta hydrolase family protein [Myroides sp. LoEW2-1]|uniref:alpha/beta hydrolase family protein n=1 Tax=Myroides sp. LoEW2-1 TaxID=2683192 RepID=UPI001328C18D|nr:prolyl oligopeptidase family serine peptidase [Myroides sp. LoEW2-1]MVX34290.1 prolyl oligopeptidase family serine peptidase [Myroides sp. LoEW2-1]